MKIVIIDYGMGNVRSVEKAFERIGRPAIISSDPNEIRDADKVVLPGVGAFGEAMHELERRNLIDVIKEVVAHARPFLGICLGLQVLFDTSEEAPEVRGLGILPGTVKRFRRGIKVPHMGWNQLSRQRETPYMQNISPDDYFYFVHSYYVIPRNSDNVVATTTYDVDFVSVVCRDNLFATQFHPEKSQHAGLRLIENFAGV